MKFSLDEILIGYIYEREAKRYRCIHCGESYEVGEIYEIAGRLLEAERAAKEHITQVHPERSESLIEDGSKYNSLTENQRRLLLFMHRGYSDKEIASELGVSISTIRHQRFTFREKAKQAKHYLAVYETTLGEREKGRDKMAEIHENAKMVDERYMLTEEERAEIIRNTFLSERPLKLKVLSPKAKKKLVQLSRIAEEFEDKKRYTEPEVNEKLRGIYDDFATMRRELIDYGFLKRTRDGKQYWKK